MSSIQERRCVCWRKARICFFCVDCQRCGAECRCDDGPGHSVARALRPQVGRRGGCADRSWRTRDARGLSRDTCDTR